MEIFNEENFILKKKPENKLGSGGYADVYKALNKINRKYYAIKVLRDSDTIKGKQAHE